MAPGNGEQPERSQTLQDLRRALDQKSDEVAKLRQEKQRNKSKRDEMETILNGIEAKANKGAAMALSKTANVRRPFRFAWPQKPGN